MKNFVKDEEILSTVINNLKNPAIAQIKALELFLNSSADRINPDEKDLIELTLNSCNYMKKMIDNFSFISKLNTEKMLLDYKYFNILDLLNSIVKEINILLKYSNLKLNIFSKENVIINADESKINNVVENFLLHSISSAYKNSDIDIFISHTKNTLKFEIKSNCPYMKEGELVNFFENTSKTSTSIQNLGLLTAKEIINAHFGRIIYKSSEDNIMTLGFYIPLK